MTRPTNDDTQAGARGLGRLVVGILLLAALTLAGPTAWAYWTSAGDGTGSATTATLDPPTTVVATFTPGLPSVGVTWTAPTAGVTPQGYYVTRTRLSDSSTAPACGSLPTEPVTGAACSDPSVPSGSYRYTVTAVNRSWTSTSASSPTVTVVADSTPPVVTVTSVNGASPSFPWRTSAAVSMIGGACGTAPGDSPTVTPLVDGTAAAPVTCTSGAWTHTLSPPLTTDATVTLSARQGDLTGNLGTAPPRTVIVDRTGPTVLSIARAGAAQSVNAGPLSWTVTFSEPVAGVAVSNFGLVRGGLTGTPTISGVTATGGSPSATWTVSVAMGGVTGTNAGWIGVNLTGSGVIADLVGNALSTTAFTGQTYTYDTVRPALGSIVRSGSSQWVNVGPLSWTVTFSEPVAGVAVSNFGLVVSGISGTPAISAVSASGGSPSASWTVSVSVAGVTGTNSGSIRLNLTGRGSVVDAAGNRLTTTSSTGPVYTYDTTPPAVNGVSSTAADGSYRAGQVIPVTVTFNEPVTVVGTPQLALATGTPATTAVDHTSSPTSTTLTFDYTVAAGNTSPDLDYEAVTSLALNGGAIRDAASNAATLTLPAPGTAGSLGGTKALIIDTTAPPVTVTHVNGSVQSFPFATRNSVTSIGGACGNAAGDATTVTVLVNGSSAGNPTCTSEAWTLGTSWTASGTWLVSATQGDAAGNSGVAPERTVVVDKTPPTVAEVSSPLADGSYRATQVIPVTVTFREPVVVTGTPRLTLATGSPATTAVDYTSGSGSSTLTFTYTVAATNTSADLDYAGTGSLALNGGTINDLVGNAATLTLPTPGATGSLGATKALVIDTARPTLTGVSSPLANGSYRADQVVPVTVTFSEPVTVGGTPRLALATGSPASTAVAHSSGSGTTTLTFEYTVAAGNTSPDLDYSSTTALTLDGGSITDAAGNAATLTLPAPGAAGSLGGTKALVIDTTPPEVGVTSIARFPFLFRNVRVSGTAEAGAGPVTVYLCYNVGPPCDAGNATQTFTNVSVGAGGTWQTGWSSSGSQGTWYARATQTDPAGNMGTSDTFGPYAN